MPSSQFLGLPEPQSSAERTRQPAIRSIKIESEGDPWKGISKPKIRLMGRWLERAGFSPGHRIQVVCVSPGVIELRAMETPKPDETVLSSDNPSSRHSLTAPEIVPLVSRPEPLRNIQESRQAALPHRAIENTTNHSRTPDQFAFCGPHFYDSSPHTRALGNFWQNCAHCGQTLKFYGSNEQVLSLAPICKVTAPAGGHFPVSETSTIAQDNQPDNPF